MVSDTILKKNSPDLTQSPFHPDKQASQSSLHIVQICILLWHCQDQLKQTAMYEMNRTDQSSKSCHFPLSETSHVIHPTRLGAVVFNLTNILIELNIAISLCYTSVASLESIS